MGHHLVGAAHGRERHHNALTLYGKAFQKVDLKKLRGLSDEDYAITKKMVLEYLEKLKWCMDADNLLSILNLEIYPQ